MMSDDTQVLWSPGLFWTMLSEEVTYEAVCERLGLERFIDETFHSPFISVKRIKERCAERRAQKQFLHLPINSPIGDRHFLVFDAPDELFELASAVGKVHQEAIDQLSRPKDRVNRYIGQMEKSYKGLVCKCLQVDWSKLHESLFNRAMELLVSPCTTWPSMTAS
ncbi:hypothetical protein BGZ63DRAFT_96028 [Mariannaea sp. PMI_226]|nr:hypothetical protein BGZ63DRAFT_96028 [Mariannaea sp. PMI_226]